MGEHSRLPWKKDVRYAFGTTLVDPDHKWVLTANSSHNNHGSFPTDAECDANVDYVELACNSHKPLVEAMRKIANIAGGSAYLDLEPDTRYGQGIEEILKIITATLADVEKEKDNGNSTN